MTKRELVKHIEYLKIRTLSSMETEYYENAKSDLVTSFNVYTQYNYERAEQSTKTLTADLEQYLDAFSKVARESGYELASWPSVKSLIRDLEKITGKGLALYLADDTPKYHEGKHYGNLSKRKREVRDQFDRILANIKSLPTKEVRAYLTNLGLMPEERPVPKKNEILAPVDMNVLAKYLRNEDAND